MKPISFAQQNHIFEAPAHHADEKLDVPCFIGKKAIAACFDVSDEEIDRIKETGRLWVIVKGDTWYPMALSTEIPIQDPTDYDFPDMIES